MFSFKLSKEFVDSYQDIPPKFGYPDSGGNSIGLITYLRTYSRLMDNGRKEEWYQTCERVLNGTFSLQKDHCRTNRLPWNNQKAQRTAQDAFDRMFNFKWSPPGRGMAQMGARILMEQRNSAQLNNCGVSSTGDMTREDPTSPFTFLMAASFLGIGIGFDLKGADKKLPLYQPTGDSYTYVIPDSREGWEESLKYVLESFLKPNKPPVVFDYSLIRAKGEPIKTFGGIAPGPGPLILLHERIEKRLSNRDGQSFSALDIADVCNMIGVCVQSGGVRRSAQLMMGSLEDKNFLHFKDYDSQIGQERSAWSHLSNNSVEAKVGDDLSAIVPGIIANGEPGVIWMDTTRTFGRLDDEPDYKDKRVASFNPCAEQPLESGELCTLCDVYIENHESLEDFKKTLKIAFMYGKTVTLVPTEWPKTNAIMQRNRRIGTSLSGVADFADSRGIPTLKKWMDEGYKEIKRLDSVYSEWLCVRESIRVTTIKPGGTTGLVAGVSPGAHWTVGGTLHMRTIRFSKTDPMLVLLRNANYTIEDDVTDPDHNAVVYFPIKSNSKRSEREVSIFEKVALAALAQRYWSDNSVSVTVSFDPKTEAQHIGRILSMYEGQLKTISFLPMLEEGAYRQMPYGRLTEEEWEESSMQLLPIDFTPIYQGLGLEAIGEEGCVTDACIIKDFVLNREEEREEVNA